MRNTAGVKIGPPSIGRRQFLRTLGATTVGAVGITGIMSPFDFARAAITPGEKGIYITDMYKTQLSGVGGVIIRLDTNKGISGYGECRDVDPNTATELSGLKSIILGMNPTQVDKVFNAIKNYNNPQSNWKRQEEHTGGMCGIEVACWDITGKVYNVPIWKLIGPKLTDKIRLYADTDQKTVATLPQYVQTRLNMGFTWFKMDMYLSSLAQGGYTVATQKNSYGYYPITINSSGYSKMVQYAQTYRSLIGTYPLSSDHYQGYDNDTQQLDVSSAVELANQMLDSRYQGMYGGWMEDIIDWGWTDANSIPVIKQVHDQTDMPILTGEDMYCLDEFQALVDAGAVDYIHPDEATAGGIHQPRLAALYAYTKGVRTALHCSGGPFSFVASLHVAAGIPDFLAQEYHHIDDAANSWFDSVVDGIEKPLINNGYSAVPEGPGLGITPNAANMSAHGASTWTRVT